MFGPRFHRNTSRRTMQSPLAFERKYKKMVPVTIYTTPDVQDTPVCHSQEIIGNIRSTCVGFRTTISLLTSLCRDSEQTEAASPETNLRLRPEMLGSIQATCYIMSSSPVSHPASPH
jgi:transposase InsO family protein